MTEILLLKMVFKTLLTSVSANICDIQAMEHNLNVFTS
jgi:hypothetical protein